MKSACIESANILASYLCCKCFPLKTTMWWLPNYVKEQFKISSTKKQLISMRSHSFTIPDKSLKGCITSIKIYTWFIAISSQKISLFPSTTGFTSPIWVLRKSSYQRNSMNRYSRVICYSAVQKWFAMSYSRTKNQIYIHLGASWCSC